MNAPEGHVGKQLTLTIVNGRDEELVLSVNALAAPHGFSLATVHGVVAKLDGVPIGSLPFSTYFRMKCEDNQW